mmetsp:Transcript_6665/g.15593  ORF Transcript_6665/g.15593 Transcript_6665/m.15593 type:complete len:83 (-) Transcript_6665:15-263(-)
MAWEPERWQGKGLPPEVEKLMTVGAQIEVEAEVGFFEVPQYPWAGAPIPGGRTYMQVREHGVCSPTLRTSLTADHPCLTRQG